MAEPSVVRLKELLFDKESRELDALAHRIKMLGESEQAARDELSGRLVELQEQDARIERAIADDERFRDRVARVLDASMRDAEKTRHQELTSAMAPMVRRTFRAELRTEATQEELSKTLYPKLGEMVQKYIASAMRDLMETINRRLEAGLTQNRFALKLRSISTGRSMAELALAETQQFRVEEIYLIRRGSGELIHHWSREPGPIAPGAGNNRDTLISGFLTAITAFAEEAFAGDRSSLRALDLDDHRIYLRASPANLVAAKCSGTAEVAVEQVLDQGLNDLLAQHNQIETAHPSDAGPQVRAAATKAHDALLGDVSQYLEGQIKAAAAKARADRGSLRPLKVALLVLGLPILAYSAWQSWIGYQTREWQRAADAAIAAEPELSGYPVSARVERGGGQIWVSGLAPTSRVRDRLLARLKELAPQATVAEAIGVLPATDVGGALEAERLRRVVESAQRRLQRLTGDLDRVQRAADANLAALEAIGAAREAAAQALTELGGPPSASADQGHLARLGEAIHRVQTATARIAGAAPQSGPQSEVRAATAPATITEGAEELALAAERMSVVLAMLEQVTAAAAERVKAIVPLEQRNSELQRDLAALKQRLDNLNIAKSPRELLEAFLRQNAIFFTNGIDYRDASGTGQILDDLIRLALPLEGLIRVVGYTDEAGGGAANPRNLALSQQRADKVADDLAARGFPRQRLVAVGRSAVLDLAPRSGATSASRRVEFEIGFKGEEAPLP